MKYDTPTTNDNINGRIGDWHNHIISDWHNHITSISLYDWLGITSDAYFTWVVSGELPLDSTPDEQDKLLINLSKELAELSRELGHTYVTKQPDQPKLTEFQRRQELDRWIEENHMEFYNILHMAFRDYHITKKSNHPTEN